jgi:hypothetical protein
LFDVATESLGEEDREGILGSLPEDAAGGSAKGDCAGGSFAAAEGDTAGGSPLEVPDDGPSIEAGVSLAGEDGV